MVRSNDINTFNTYFHQLSILNIHQHAHGRLMLEWFHYSVVVRIWFAATAYPCYAYFLSKKLYRFANQLQTAYGDDWFLWVFGGFAWQMALEGRTISIQLDIRLATYDVLGGGEDWMNAFNSCYVNYF